jgi:hypothetical protein
MKKGPQKGQVIEVVKRKHSLGDVLKVSLRYVFMVMAVELISAEHTWWCIFVPAGI